MSPEREKRFKEVIARRQPNITVVLENVHDSHNIGAVLRTCDSIGIMEIFVLYTEENLTKEILKLGKRTSSGARRWVDVHLYNDAEECFGHIKKKYENIWATHLNESAVSLYDIDLSASVALVFGNERDGLSEEALSYCTGNFIIPQMGMVQSLNISVACAVTLYEAMRQRNEKGYYSDAPLLDKKAQEDLYSIYLERHESKDKRRKAFSKEFYENNK